jgi:hypothetical protein
VYPSAFDRYQPRPDLWIRKFASSWDIAASFKVFADLIHQVPWRAAQAGQYTRAQSWDRSVCVSGKPNAS